MKAALFSLTDKTGSEDLAQALSAAGYTILSTGGTKKHLEGHGVKVVSIEDYTGQREILDGRVKTLHPKIHAGILARRDEAAHMAELTKAEIMPIDFVVVNLYPFLEKVRQASKFSLDEMIEFVDIGGPSMLRAASKNFHFCLPILDPTDYPQVIAGIKAGKFEDELKLKLAEKVFTNMAHYDLSIAKYISLRRQGEQSDYTTLLAPISGMVLQKQQDLRYGENPQQAAGYYRQSGATSKTWQQLGGKELSYNNLLDFGAALDIVRSFGTDPMACIVKHLNPCGLASSETALMALKLAKRCDPRSHFGGIIAFNREVDLEIAQEIGEGFVEIVVAPNYSPQGLEELSRKKNLRIIRVDLNAPVEPYDMRMVEGGVLIQAKDLSLSDIKQAKVVSKRTPTDWELIDLQFAWNACRFVKSNAVVVAKHKMLLGVGAGQMSRIDSTEVAIMKARTHGHDLSGAVCASDAFFPFPDSLEKLAECGVAAFVAPGGAKKDPEVIAAADKAGVALLFTEDRHFRH